MHLRHRGLLARGIRAALRIGKKGLRNLRRKGLQIHYVGAKGFILGADFLAFLANLPTSRPGVEG